MLPLFDNVPTRRFPVVTVSLIAANFAVFGVLPIPIPAIIVLGSWFVYQLFDGGASLTQPQAGGGVAFFALVGGFVFGLLTVKLLQVRAPLEPGQRG